MPDLFLDEEHLPSRISQPLPKVRPYEQHDEHQQVMGRLAGLLLDVFGDAGDEFRARELTLEDMAARIGTTQEMVCRHLYRFAEKGAIEIRRTELRITNRSILEKQVGKVQT